MPLHSQAVMLQADGLFGEVHPAFGLLAMWMPLGYRDELRRAGVLSDPHATPCCSDNSLGVLLGGHGSLTSDELVLLVMLSEYPTASRGCGPHEPIELLVAARVRELTGGSVVVSPPPRHRRVDPFLDALRSLWQVGHSMKAGRLGRAATALEELRAAVRRLGARYDPWVVDLLDRRVRWCEVSLDLRRGRPSALEAGLALLARGCETTSRVGSWSIDEFRRRRLERLTQHLLKAAAFDEAKQAAEEVVGLDPYDARAWLTFGDAMCPFDPAAALRAYRRASHLDPTVTGIAAFRAGALLERRHVVSEALLEYKRAMDFRPDGAAAEAILRLTPPRHPLAVWASAQPQSHVPWVFGVYRPFFDLGDPGPGPLMALGPGLAFGAWADRDAEPGRPNLQRMLPPAFRQSLCQQAGLPAYDVWDPLQLDERHWTPRWEDICTGLAHFDHLEIEERVLLMRVLMMLAMWEALIYYLPDYADCRERPTDAEATLSYLYAFAEHMLHLGAPRGAYTPRRIERVARRAPRGSRAAFAAQSKMLIYSARFAPSADDATAWAQRARESLEGFDYSPNSYSGLMWWSRFHRAVAYVPYLRGDCEGALRHMSIAETYGRRLLPRTSDEQVLKSENLYTILESTAKTLIDAGRLVEAEAVTLRSMRYNPWDSKTSLELGNIRFRLGKHRLAAEAYEAAACIGPPGTEIAAYLAGEARMYMGERESARHLFLLSLTADHHGRSPRRRLDDLEPATAKSSATDSLKPAGLDTGETLPLEPGETLPLESAGAGRWRDPVGSARVDR
ncbi:MAG TPA: hypothetical protein VG053_09415 [Solirubrobacteraceae bacterium]|jgi:tetratricopeptide (TPR) repeat protein|nr:hypothetical protein [Solirubrobacteraceae bacterium]